MGAGDLRAKQGQSQGKTRGNKRGALYRCEGGKHLVGTRNHPKWLKPRGAEA